ncbi:hypothetical protein QUA41_31090 [Microcoleus sp. Pol11C1]|uniref:hypothetical protein n=1 Tax=unclassified Microcoleus TaxID=2642155 RepID=UPI002FD124DD
MKVSKLIELLSQCSPDAEVRIYFPGGDFSDSVETVENHIGWKRYEQFVFLYGFPATEEELQKIWAAEKIKVVAQEAGFLKTEAS